MESFRIAFSKLRFALCRSPLKEACAEFLGTFLLVVCGDGVMASITLSRLGNHAALVSAFGWGLALMIGISVAGGVSGAHLNPAITVALATVRKCSWKNVLYYLIAQYHAGFFAAAVVYFVYADAISHFDNGIRQVPPEVNSTAEIFSTYPQDFTSIGSCFVDQIVGTALLLLVVCAVTDSRNSKLSTQVQSVVIGLGLTAVCLAFGFNCGAPLNPARDLPPRAFTATFGWGFKVFSFRSYTWFLIPVVGPHVGAILGVWLYDLFIETPFRNYVLLTNESDALERTEEGVRDCGTDTENSPAKTDRSTSPLVDRSFIDQRSTQEERSTESLPGNVTIDVQDER